MRSRYETVKEIETVVSGFENCTTAKEEFTHLSHLTVATYYIHSSTPAVALEQMRHGLLRFLDHHGINRARYDERLTSAWVEKIRRFIEQLNVDEQLDTDASLVAITNAVLDELGQHQLTSKTIPIKVVSKPKDQLPQSALPEKSCETCFSV